MLNAAVSSHIHAATRGRLRSATTVITVTWAMKLPGAHGQSPEAPPNTATTGAAAIENQNAPIGRISVASTGSRARRPHSRGPKPSSPSAAV